jgi:hypothetical protein
MTVIINGTTGIDTVQDGIVTDDKLNLTANSQEIKDALNATGSAPIYACRAWVTFTSALSISGGGNISSITNNAAGDFTLNFTTAMPDTNYSISGFVRSDIVGALNSVHVLTSPNGATKTTTQARLLTRYANSGADGQFFHPETCVVIFR